MIYNENAAIVLSERLKEIKERIAQAALRSGRGDKDVFLVAATKTQPSEIIKEALRTGKIDFAGENRVQELRGHLEDGAYLQVPVHFIGHLQTNKLKYVVGKVKLIQSVDSINLASEVAKQAQKAGVTQDILLELNVAGEESKFGFSPERLDEILPQVSKISGINVRGIMAIPPKQEIPGQNRPYFERLRQVFIDSKAKKYDNVFMDYLSMGMSEDYYDAILCGSNMVRIGTAIFGKREA
ncbi:MAG: YggS family pyridoxal phosphate-dependent enzyme [Bacillota bacterium]|nr:YggS family pyridoxal phosphate-dependent enzyme [Bacillota bacterium]